MNFFHQPLNSFDIELPLDFKKFLKSLNERGVRCLLIGGYAVASMSIYLVMIKDMVWSNICYGKLPLVRYHWAPTSFLSLVAALLRWSRPGSVDKVLFRRAPIG